MLGTISHHARRQQSFLGHWNIARSRGNNAYGSLADNFCVAFDRDHAREWMKFRQSRFFSSNTLHSRKRLGIGARNQNVVLAVLLRQHRPHDLRNLLWSFSLAENDLGKSLAQSAMMVYLCKIQIFKRQMLQPLD